MIYGTTGFSMVEIWRKKHIDLSNSWRKERSEHGRIKHGPFLLDDSPFSFVFTGT